MIDKDCAIEAKEHALNACLELNEVLLICQANCSADEYQQIVRGVGLSHGSIQIDLLDLIYEAYPEISDVN